MFASNSRPVYIAPRFGPGLWSKRAPGNGCMQSNRAKLLNYVLGNVDVRQQLASGRVQLGNVQAGGELAAGPSETAFLGRIETGQPILESEIAHIDSNHGLFVLCSRAAHAVRRDLEYLGIGFAVSLLKSFADALLVGLLPEHGETRLKVWGMTDSGPIQYKDSPIANFVRPWPALKLRSSEKAL